VDRWRERHGAFKLTGNADLKTTVPQSNQALLGLHHSGGNLQQPAEARLSNKPIPTKTLRKLRGLLKEGKGCPHTMCRHRSSGTTTWKLDPINTAIARAVVASLEMQQFGGESLANAFLGAHLGDWVTNLRALCGDRWSLDANQLALARKRGIIDELPCITEDEIDDLSKGDLFLKVLAVFQILWLCIQLITRLSRKLPATQLEVVTFAFAVTSIVTYGLLLSRPKDVQTVREVYAVRDPTPVELTQLAATGPSYPLTSHRDVSISNDAFTLGVWVYFYPSVIAILVVFGGLHLLAWNYEFPTHVEKILWRASAIVTLAAMPSMYIITLGADKFAQDDNIWFGIALVISMGLFVAARAFILVEIVRSLAFQPPETFRTTWAANVPHVG
jgi:hypothetical protein